VKLAIALVTVILSFLAVQVGLTQTLPGDPGTITPKAARANARLWASTVRSFEFGLGWSAGEDMMGDYRGPLEGAGRGYFHVDHTWESFEAVYPSERYYPDYGSGSRIEHFLVFDGPFQIITPSGIPLDPGIGAKYIF
jgi:hypothetical protein